MNDSDATDRVTRVVINVRVTPGEEKHYLDWQHRINAEAAKFAGYMGSEVSMPKPDDPDGTVTVTYQFATPESLRAWMDSDVRQSMLGEAQGRWMDNSQVAVSSAPVHERGATLVISHDVPPGRLDDFMKAMEHVQQVESTFPGYKGVTLLEPVPGVQPAWTSLARFDTRAHLENWLHSDERAEAIRSFEDADTEFRIKVADDSFGQWFDFNRRGNKVTPNWKQWLTVLLVLYPTVMLLGFITEYMPGGAKNTAFPLPDWFFANMWIGNFLSTFLLAFAFMPLINRALSWWLNPAAALKVTIWGTLLVIGLFIASMAVFGAVCTSGCSIG